MRPAVILFLLAVVLVVPAVADVPDLYVHVLGQAPEPVTVYVTPAGNGTPLSSCFDQEGNPVVDGTITIQLTNGGVPVPGVPAEDIWLEGGWTSLPEHPFTPCLPCGSCADHSTDVNGVTTFSRSLAGGGAGIDPAGRNLLVYVNGEIPPQDPLGDYRVTSPDMNGDLVVNLSDLYFFAQAFNSGDTAGDFNGDGVVNLVDLILFSRSFGETCSVPPQ